MDRTIYLGRPCTYSAYLLAANVEHFDRGLRRPHQVDVLLVCFALPELIPQMSCQHDDHRMSRYIHPS